MKYQEASRIRFRKNVLEIDLISHRLFLRPKFKQIVFLYLQVQCTYHLIGKCKIWYWLSVQDWIETCTRLAPLRNKSHMNPHLSYLTIPSTLNSKAEEIRGRKQIEQNNQRSRAAAQFYKSTLQIQNRRVQDEFDRIKNYRICFIMNAAVKPFLKSSPSPEATLI